MKKIMLIFGTRPECIKMAPVIRLLSVRNDLEVSVCNTGQHMTMTDQMLKVFEIEADYNLNVMREDQSLSSMTVEIIKKMDVVLQACNPDMVLVQGDTTTAFVSSLVCYYHQISVGHVEAGLRTHQRFNPFPEELNRQLTGVLADYHFAPTDTAKQNMLKEGISETRIFITGNTVIDSLMYIMDRIKKNEIAIADNVRNIVNNSKDFPIILITAHRRESFGSDIKNICLAIRELAQMFPLCSFVYPVHLNPNIKKPVYEHLDGIKNIHLIRPLDYFSFSFLMSRSYLILTDSGGIQEEAPSLGKPLLVLRNKTERPEGVEKGVAKLVGVQKEKIVAEAKKLMEDRTEYNKMVSGENPYGDGHAADKIVGIISKEVFA